MSFMYNVATALLGSGMFFFALSATMVYTKADLSFTMVMVPLAAVLTIMSAFAIMSSEEIKGAPQHGS